MLIHRLLSDIGGSLREARGSHMTLKGKILLFLEKPDILKCPRCNRSIIVGWWSSWRRSLFNTKCGCGGIMSPTPERDIDNLFLIH